MTVFAAVVLLASLAMVAGQAPNPCYRAQMPNNRDPYSFYKCDAGGKAHLWRCSPGTMYDRRTEICDWEDKVRARNGGQGGRCPPYNGNTGKIPNQGGRPPVNGNGRQPGPLSPDYDNGEDWNEYQAWRETFRDEGRGTSTGKGPMNCANTSPNSPPKLYQNPDDCSTFYTCNMGRPVLTYCPRGYNFNPRLQGCDDTVPSGCRVKSGSQSPTNVFIYARSLGSSTKSSDPSVPTSNQ
ncbi:Cuticular protein analogous to peritrophins 3-A2 [Nesidiocoris tenuis]|uniref:Cuticular protein analogous to peritrophins 3-A2 n=1 Tax=Nesidiocoris tenuis TaxID=355587 RepID=A0ABN7ALM2_9HEMI|nr:Cuticular protein analogous to peritrophins 3-A2 [Nesidiocoris tenuis]